MKSLLILSLVSCSHIGDRKIAAIPSSDISQIVSGDNFSCALLRTSEVECWGYLKPNNKYAAAELAKQLKQEIASPSKILAQGSTLCGFTKELGYRCVGYSVSTKDEFIDHRTEKYMQYDPSAHLIQVEERGGMTCILKQAADKRIAKCWGEMSRYMVESGTMYTLSLREPRFLKDPSTITIGSGNVCMIDRSVIKCSGAGGMGLVDVPKGLKDPEVLQKLKIEKIIAGELYMCAVSSLVGLNCWGSLDSFIESGAIKKINSEWPVTVFAGPEVLCANLEEGLTCFENKLSARKQLVLNIPQDIKESRANKIAFGKDHACAILDSGIKCWGRNDNGQLNVPEDLRTDD